ncbi:unnamed protein product [Triticum turgidum subsp. durum]|uniref:Uncharacterized protein n=1 Tax=Triticum turgidum subsp. durum TaxID=4567 RepID=A0A9R0RDW5_TRITD|nr:unnamed protein product [Triticum turgidum subsp. durum]
MLSNSRNGRSSHDHLRLCEQVSRLEFEYERLKKDASIYHNLHEQLQLSSCYKLVTIFCSAHKQTPLPP